MHLYHQNCPPRRRWSLLVWLFGRAGVPRFILKKRSLILGTRTYRCDECGAVVHIDLDWTEDLDEVEVGATFH